MRYVLIILFALIASCQHTGLENNHEVGEQSLEHRADAYWQAWVDEDWETVLEMNDPQTREQFASRIQSMTVTPMAKYMDYKRLDIQADGDQGQVKYEVRIKYLHPLLATLQPQDKIFVDTWVRRNGVWYRSMHRPHDGEVMESFQSLQDSKGGGD